MSTFRVLVFSNNVSEAKQVTQSLQNTDLEIRIGRHLIELFDQPYSAWYAWHIDIQGVPNLLRKLLPALRRRLPRLTMIGLMSRSSWERTSLAFDSRDGEDSTGNAGPENVIVMFPCCAETYWLGAQIAAGQTAARPVARLV